MLMLLITVGSSAAVSWIVTMSVTKHETERANDQISLAISRYARHLETQHQQMSRIVRALLEAPAQRSLLQSAGDPADSGAKEQLRQEVLGRDVQAELRSGEGSPAFHVVLNLAHEVVVVAAADARLETRLFSNEIRWPADQVINGKGRAVIKYIATAEGLFLAMGIPLRTQLDEAPDHAYFVGFRVDDAWVRQQLLAEQGATLATTAPLAAWFVVDGKVIAKASSDVVDAKLGAFQADTPLTPLGRENTEVRASSGRVAFEVDGEHYLGQSFSLNAEDAASGRLILASSLDRALAPLHRLQKQILWTALAACLVAMAACRAIAAIIARPLAELVAGTRRISNGQFDMPVKIRRRDELGTLANSFNEMALGLKERDVLREGRLKMERDLALARKIQMDVLPKELPECPGYDLAAFSLPAEQTGGDIYDLIATELNPLNQVERPSMVLLLADATGHGIGPALSVTQVRSMLRIGVRLGVGLEAVFSQINRQLCQDLGSDRFVTAFLGLLEPSSHTIKYHSAGQAPLLHFHAQSHRFEWLNSSMIPLGIMEEAESDGVQLMLMDPGDLIILLTDGFYEFQNDRDQYFGQERVAEIVLRHHHRPAQELLHEILAATQAFSGGAAQMDDMTGLIIRRLPADEPASQPFPPG